MAHRTLLHVGCGPDPLPAWMAPGTVEVRLDIEPAHGPDIVADMRYMPEDLGGFDIVFSNHCLEHVYPHEVRQTLEGFRRVLADGGSAVINVPDLEGVMPTNDVLFVSPSGPIAGLDLIYGHRELMRESIHMAHHCGFTADTLEEHLAAAGFRDIHVQRLSDHNLLGVGRK